MKGSKIHIFEELALPGGSMDGIYNPERGYIIRGGREMEAHFETLWDLFRSIPSLENPDVSVLDEFYWLNKADPSFSHTRVIERRGKRLPTDGKLTLTPGRDKRTYRPGYDARRGPKRCSNKRSI